VGAAVVVGEAVVGMGVAAAAGAALGKVVTLLQRVPTSRSRACSQVNTDWHAFAIGVNGTPFLCEVAQRACSHETMNSISSSWWYTISSQRYSRKPSGSASWTP
jgi:hypothetical protein